MRVLYDGVIYRIQRYGGVVRYFNGLIHHLPPSIHPILLAPNRPAVAPQHPNLATHIETCESLLWPIKPLRKKIIAHRSYNRVALEQPDVIHPTYYYSSLRHLNERIDIPTVLTVYDLIHEKFPRQMDPYGKQIRLKQNALQRADAIVCISESTRRDLLNHYAVPEDRVEVIYPGCEFTPVTVTTGEAATFRGGDLGTVACDTHQGSRNGTTELACELPGSQRYLLYVGERSFYKNFDRTLQAFSRIAPRFPELELKCVGGKPFSHAEKQRMVELKIERRVTRLPHVPDQQIQSIYSAATALIYPSLYEGFGIPILEGMSCGTPVLTSNRASMPEVAGDGAILFDPYSVDEIAETMRQIGEDESLRQTMIRKGLARAARFSLSHSAQRMAEIYRAVARRSEVAA